MRPSRLPEHRPYGPSVFLSPHYDDVVLSCGGTVALLVEQGEPPLVLTIFGGEVTDEVTTDFAASVREHAERIGEGEPAERFWPVVVRDG